MRQALPKIFSRANKMTHNIFANAYDVEKSNVPIDANSS